MFVLHLPFISKERGPWLVDYTHLEPCIALTVSCWEPPIAKYRFKSDVHPTKAPCECAMQKVLSKGGKPYQGILH